MWKVAQELIPILIILFFLSQVVYPILTNKPTFGLFRRKAKKVEATKGHKNFDEEVEDLGNQYEEKEKSLEELISDIDEKAEKVNQLKEKTKKNK